MVNELQDSLNDGEEFADITDERQVQDAPADREPEEDLPEKYRGKSPKEIAKMHQEAEKLIGRHSNEVAELRRLADDLIKQQLKQPKEESPEVDFFEDPKAAVKQTLKNTDEFRELQELKQKLKLQETQDYLAKKHGNYQEKVNSPEFIEWVKASKVRMELFAAAHQNFDKDAADELLSNFSLYQVGSKAPSQQETRDKQLKSAGVENSGSGAGATKKVYRRADLIRLKMQDPSRYMALQDEIMAAYNEGRVR